MKSGKTRNEKKVGEEEIPRLRPHMHTVVLVDEWEGYGPHKTPTPMQRIRQ